MFPPPTYLVLDNPLCSSENPSSFTKWRDCLNPTEETTAYYYGHYLIYQVWCLYAYPLLVTSGWQTTYALTVSYHSDFPSYIAYNLSLSLVFSAFIIVYFSPPSSFVPNLYHPIRFKCSRLSFIIVIIKLVYQTHWELCMVEQRIRGIRARSPHILYLQWWRVASYSMDWSPVWYAYIITPKTYLVGLWAILHVR